MSSRRLSVVFVSLAALVTSWPASSVFAQGRSCPKGSAWDTSEGSCVKVRKVRKKSPQQMTQEGLKLLDEKEKSFKPKRGLALLKKSCARDSGGGCYALGWFYRHGRYVEKSIAESKKLFAQACKLKDSRGCRGVADLYSDGLLGKKADHKKAIPFLSQACALGNGDSCYQLGQKYSKALGTKTDKKKAAANYERAVTYLTATCPKKAKDCYNLGLAHWYGLGTKKDNAKALETWRKGCDGGAGRTCAVLGDAYRNGWGTAKDQLRAKTFYDKACTNLDNAYACNAVGFMMLNWAPSARDERALRRYAKRACELDKRKCLLRGNLYTTGVAVPKDQRLASKYFMDACESGEAEGCYVSANRVDIGNGVPKSRARAIELWDRACDMSWGSSCRKLGDVYRSGDGRTKNLTTAGIKYQLACFRDDGLGCVSTGDLIASGDFGKSLKADLYFRRACTLKVGLGCRRLSAAAAKKKDAKDALSWLEKGCNYGDGDSCLAAGRDLYFGNNGIAADKGKAARMFALACQSGSTESCWWIDQALGEATDGGKRDKAPARTALRDACLVKERAPACQVLGRVWVYGGNVDSKQVRRGVKMFRDRCDAKDGAACLELGMVYAAGLGVVKDEKKAEEIYRRECEKNTPSACNMLGLQQWNRGEYADALTLFHRGCEEKDGPACNVEAFAYYTGKGHRWNAAKGAELYQKSCELGYPLACANVGELHRIGVVVEKDAKKSFDAYSKGCTPTESAGCTFVGRAYHVGGVVEVDLERAEREYLRTCNDEDWASAESCLFLAELYAKTGKGSASKIASLRQQAFQLAEKNLDDSGYYHHLIGVLHRDGVATVADLPKALEHWKLGCDAYDPQSCLVGAELLLRGAPGIEVDRKRAMFMSERACAAAIAGGCELAEEARKPPEQKTPETPATPGTVNGNKGCAGCASHHGGASGSLLLLFAAFFLLRRRR